MNENQKVSELMEKISRQDFFMYVNICSLSKHDDYVLVDGPSRNEVMLNEAHQLTRVLNSYAALYEVGFAAFRQLLNETDQSVLMDRRTGRTFWLIRQKPQASKV